MFALNAKHAILSLAATLVVGAGGLSVVSAADSIQPAQGRAEQTGPLWAQRPLVSSSRALVARVVATATADVVLLEGGHNEGFRDGMACEIFRGNELIAELMIVHCETERSAALITALRADTGIHPGDVANIKTVHSF